MSKLVIMGTVEVASGKRDRVASLLMAHRARCLVDEPGTLNFELALPREDQQKILIYEVYKDDDAFELHRKSPSIAQLREEAAGMILNIVAAKCDPVR